QSHRSFATITIDPLANCPRADACGFGDGLRRLPARNLPYNPLSTKRREPGILVHVHPVLPRIAEASQLQLPRSGPGGQPNESSQLANRLSEDGDANVLLIVGRDWHPYIHIPLGLGRMHDYGMFDWGYQADPEPNLNNRRIEAMRGKVLGGSSSINVMAYTRGNRGDYDRWAQKGAGGWSYADVLPYFLRCETFEKGANTWRGGSGPLGTEFARTRDPLYEA